MHIGCMWLTQVMAVRTRPGPGWTRTRSLIYALALDPVDFNARLWPVNTRGHLIPSSGMGFSMYSTLHEVLER